VNSIALAPDQRTLVSGSSDMTVRAWALPEGTARHTFRDRKKPVASVAISPDGAWVAAASYGGRAMVWALAGEEVVGIQAGDRNLSKVVFSPDGSLLATCGIGGDILVWSLPDGEPVATLSGHEVAVLSVVFIDGGRALASLGYERTIRLWDTQRWEETGRFSVEAEEVRRLCFSSDEGLAAVSTRDSVQLWSTEDWRVAEGVSLKGRAVGGTAFSPDGRWLAIGTSDGNVRVWEL
jgi:WD40 repeat protein